MNEPNFGLSSISDDLIEYPLPFLPLCAFFMRMMNWNCCHYPLLCPQCALYENDELDIPEGDLVTNG